MREKYLLRFDNEAVGIRYDLEAEEIMIGGAIRLRQDMEMFIEEYFDSEAPSPVFIQGRKARYDFPLPKRKFDAGLKRLKDNGLIERVESLGRIIR